MSNNLEATKIEKRKPRPTASKVFANIFVAIFSVLAFRWLLFEMFLIPSGSMYPHLFVRDYIIATKFDFGLRVPFSQSWVYGPKVPERGEVVIFKSLDDSKFFIKRVVGLPGDKLEIEGDFIFSINGELTQKNKLSEEEHSELAKYMEMEEENSFISYKEALPDVDSSITILTSGSSREEKKTYNVPPGHLLVMGDNRHKSFDGRFFGYLPLNHLIGKARRIVFSCGQYNPGTTSCDFNSLRTDRLGKSVGN